MTGTAGLGVASWNIHKGVGTDRRRDLGRTAAVIAEMAPDILALQEADTRFGTRTGLLDLASLERDTGLVPVPIDGVGPAHGWHGNLILTRGAVVGDVHRIALPGLEPRGAVIVDLAVGPRRLRVIGTHLGLLPASRAAQARVILDHLGRLDARPTVLMGDLNEWRTGGSALWHLARKFQIMPPVPSFPARWPVLPLDRMMGCRTVDLAGVATHGSPLARRASDHLPITGRMRWRDDPDAAGRGGMVVDLGGESSNTLIDALEGWQSQLTNFDLSDLKCAHVPQRE